MPESPQTGGEEGSRLSETTAARPQGSFNAGVLLSRYDLHGEALF